MPVKEYYTEELEKSSEDKIKALEYQKYYTGGAIILMFVVLVSMYLILNWIFLVRTLGNYILGCIVGLSFTLPVDFNKMRLMVY